MHLPPPTGGDFIPPPAGSHIAVCYRVIDLGTQQTTYLGQSKLQRKIMISWEIPDEKMDDGRPFTISKRYTFSSSEKANLRHDLENWRGAKFRDEEIQQFDTRKLIGVGCMLSVIHEEKDGRTYSNIASVAKLPKGITPPALENATAYFSLVDPDWKAFDALSDGLKGVIQKSPEYAEAMRTNSNDEPPPRTSDDLDDSIPF